MDAAEALALRADVAAEAHLAETVGRVYSETDERFSDEQIDALRQTYKLGWATGYREALIDQAALLEQQLKEEEEKNDG